MKILICGAGAIGSNLTARLVSDLKGEHEITVLDRDDVEERNTRAGTQFYTPDQIGLPKVEALQFNIYKNYSREIDIKYEEIQEFLNIGWGLVIDCFDNREARGILQKSWERRGHPKSFALLHIGFSNAFTFAIEWARGYQVPTDIEGLDICELPGASAFVNVVASMGALVAEEYILKNQKLEILGGKFQHTPIQ